MRDEDSGNRPDSKQYKVQISGVNSLEEAAEKIGLSSTEISENREQLVEVVNTINVGLRVMPRASSVILM